MSQLQDKFTNLKSKGSKYYKDKEYVRRVFVEPKAKKQKPQIPQLMILHQETEDRNENLFKKCQKLLADIAEKEILLDSRKKATADQIMAAAKQGADERRDV